MPQESYAWTVPIANTFTKANPLVQNLAQPPRNLRKIHVLVPPGPRGEVGFAFGMGGVALYPTQNSPNSNAVTSQWLILNDFHFDFEPYNAPNSGAWQLIAYNTGLFSHTLYIWFELDPIDQTQPPAVPFSLGQLNASLAAGQGQLGSQTTSQQPAGPPPSGPVAPPGAAQ